MIRPSTSCDFTAFAGSPSPKCVHFQLDTILDSPPNENTRPKTPQIRSILKRRQFSNLLKMANDKMLRELEQCVAERDRLSASIAAAPADLSRLSPRTQSAQMRYRADMVVELERVSALIEDKHCLLRETLIEEDMPSWMLGKDDSIAFTLVGHKKPTQLKLFRRQSSLFAFQSVYKKSEFAGDLFSRISQRLAAC